MVIAIRGTRTSRGAKPDDSILGALTTIAALEIYETLLKLWSRLIEDSVHHLDLDIVRNAGRRLSSCGWNHFLVVMVIIGSNCCCFRC